MPFVFVVHLVKKNVFLEVASISNYELSMQHVTVQSNLSVIPQAVTGGPQRAIVGGSGLIFRPSEMLKTVIGNSLNVFFPLPLVAIHQRFWKAFAAQLQTPR